MFDSLPELDAVDNSPRANAVDVESVTAPGTLDPRAGTIHPRARPSAGNASHAQTASPTVAAMSELDDRSRNDGATERSQRANVARAQRLRELHVPGDPLVLVNVWDVVGARAVQAAGALAVATASYAMSAARGLPDGEGLDLADVLAVVGGIAAAVEVPVTVDLERGFGATPDDVAASVTRVLEAGAVGCNIEDSLVPLGVAADDGLRGVDEQCARLAAARDAGAAAGIPLVLNARTDALARGESVAETVARGRVYLDAGADCVLVAGRVTLPDVATLVEAFDGRLNVLGRPGQPSIVELSRAGVCRISIGSSGVAIAEAALHRAAVQLLARGDYLTDQAFALP